jgi:hypothetical protein
MEYRKIIRAAAGACLLIGLTAASAAAISKQVRDEFAKTFDVYRSAYRDFEVKKLAYQASPSFINQDAYIAAAANTLVQRDQVWARYWQILVSEASAQPGIDSATQSAINTDLSREIAFLSEHRQTLEQARTPAALNESAQAVNRKQTEYLTLAYATNLALKHNQLTHAVRELETLRQKLLGQVPRQLLEPAVVEARTRALLETGERLNQAAADLAVIDAADESRWQYEPDRAYEEWQEKAAPVYAAIRQSYTNLKELSQGIEL